MPPVGGFGIAEGSPNFLGKTATICEGKVLKSGREEICLPEIQGEQLAACVFSEIACVDIVNAERNDSTVFLIEIDAAPITGQVEG
jgi:hypothetical protein